MTFSQRALLLFCVITSVFAPQDIRVEASTDGDAEFASPTKKTTNMGASDFMLGLYLKLAKPSGEVVNPGAIKGNRVHGFIDNGGSSDRVFKFNVSIPRQQHVRFTELGLHKLPPKELRSQRSLNSTVTILVNDLWNNSLLATQKVTLGTTGWISIVLPKRTIRRWNRHAGRNAGISVHVAPQNMSSAVRFSTRQTNETFQPILVVHCRDPGSIFPKEATLNPNLRPQRRSARSTHSGSAGKCGVRNLTIYFKDLGWDKWFIAPKMYSSNYCGGTCLDRHNTQIMSNHALVQLLVHEKDSSSAHAPCCVPNSMSALSMLYFGDSGQSTYVLKTVDGFIVRSCACR